MTTPDHAAALALLDKITPKHWGLWSDEGDDFISVCAQDAPPVNGWLDVMQDEGHKCVAMAHGESNARAIAALPELAALYRETARYHQASIAISFAANEAERLQRIDEMLAAWEAVVAALAAVADKLTNQPKSQGE